MIKRYFYIDNFYKSLIKKKKTQNYWRYKKILKYKKKIKFVYQNKPLGTGDAVLKTRKFIKNSYFLMLLPDDLIMKKNCSKDMIRLHKKYNASVMASMSVKKNNVNRWGIYSVASNIDRRNFVISDVIEKPTVKEAPSKNAVIGRYILSRDIFKILKKQKKEKWGNSYYETRLKLWLIINPYLLAINFQENI